MLKEANATAAVASGKKDALSYKPNLKAMASGSEDGDSMDEEEGESDMDDQESLSKGSVQSSGVSQEDGVYKAPKIRAVMFDDDAKADRKERQKDAYERKRMGKSELI